MAEIIVKLLPLVLMFISGFCSSNYLNAIKIDKVREKHLEYVKEQMNFTEKQMNFTENMIKSNEKLIALKEQEIAITKKNMQSLAR